MDEESIYEQAKDISPLEKKYYLTWYQERFTENNCNEAEKKKTTLKLGLHKNASNNSLLLSCRKALFWERDDVNLTG
jgi:uncharacterized protein YueI